MIKKLDIIFTATNPSDIVSFCYDIQIFHGGEVQHICILDDQFNIISQFYIPAVIYNDGRHYRSVESFLDWYEIENVRIIVHDSYWDEECYDGIYTSNLLYFTGIGNIIHNATYDYSRDAILFS